MKIVPQPGDVWLDKKRARREVLIERSGWEPKGFGRAYLITFHTVTVHNVRKSSISSVMELKPFQSRFKKKFDLEDL